jgi:hypothetical protein
LLYNIDNASPRSAPSSPLDEKLVQEIWGNHTRWWVDEGCRNECHHD